MDRLLNVMTILSIVLMLVVLFSVRRSHIRVEYSVSWLGAGLQPWTAGRSAPWTGGRTSRRHRR